MYRFEWENTLYCIFKNTKQISFLATVYELWEYMDQMLCSCVFIIQLLILVSYTVHFGVLWLMFKSFFVAALVYFVSQQPITTSSHYNIHFDAVDSSLWSTTRLGPWTDLVSSVHCPPAATLQMPSSHASWIWTLSAVWYWQAHTAGLCLHWWGFSVDERKSAATESC